LGRANPAEVNPRTGRLVIEIAGRIAGGGLVLSVDSGQRAATADIVDQRLRAQQLTPQKVKTCGPSLAKTACSCIPGPTKS